MRALVVDRETRQARLDERPEPSPGPGEALVRVRRAGICGTDLEILRGYLDFDGVLGHEFVGRVERCDSEPAWIGKRVVGELNVACRTCSTCLRGLPRHCERRTVVGIDGRDGAIASFVTLPAGNLHEVPPTVGDEHAVFTEPLAAALEILEQVHVRPSSEVLLLGDGRLGQLVGQVLALTGCDLLACGKHPSKLERLRARGAKTVMLDDLPERKFDVVVEATGSSAGAEIAVRHCRPRGTVVLKTTSADRGGIPSVPVVIDEIRVVGSRCGDFEPALRLLAAGKVEVAGLIAGVYPLSKAREALAFARGRDVLKVLVDMSEEQGA